MAAEAAIQILNAAIIAQTAQRNAPAILFKPAAQPIQADAHMLVYGKTLIAEVQRSVNYILTDHFHIAARLHGPAQDGEHAPEIYSTGHAQTLWVAEQH